MHMRKKTTKKYSEKMKESMLHKEVSFFPALTTKKPEKRILYDLLMSYNWRKEVLDCRMKLGNEGKEAYKKAKMKLPLYTVSGLFDGSNDASLIKHSGLICIDIDKQDNPELEDLDRLKELISEVSCVAYCGLSVSAQGYFCIIPISNPDKHELHFRALEEDFARCHIKIDTACKNVGRKRFVSYDTDPYINLKAETYNRLYGHESVQPKRDIIHPLKIGDTRKKVLSVIEQIEKAHIDITGNYIQWINVGFALAYEFGEEGRDMFHRVSSVADSYDYGTADKKYTDLIRKANGSVKIGTFFEYAKQAGIKV